MKIDAFLPANNSNSIDNNNVNTGAASTRKLSAVPEDQIQKPEQTKRDQLPKQEDLEKAFGQVKEKFNEFAEVGFEYVVDKETNREVVKIYDKQTKEVIRQFPPEEILSMLEKMSEMMGFLVDQKA